MSIDPAMAPRPLPDPAEPAEPHLELLPGGDVARELADEEPVVLSEPTDPQMADPLKLYVRQIGDGRAAHRRRRSASSRAARTRATRRPRSG